MLYYSTVVRVCEDSPACVAVLEFVQMLTGLRLTVFASFVPVAKNVFRVRSVDPVHGQSHTLFVNDVYHKQQWLNCLRTALAQQQGAPATLQQGEAKGAKRRSSTPCDEETDENCPSVCGPKLRPQTLSKTRLDQKLRASHMRKETGV